MKKLEVEYIDTGELKPYENNAKIHTDAQIEQIAKSIQEFGMNDPIAVWKDNEIIEGHGRLLACQMLGIKEVPIIRLDGLTDEQRRAYMNVHNQLTMNTGFDIELLAKELGRIEKIDMAKFGFDISSMEPEDGEVIEDDYTEPEQIQPKTKLGDVYRLGDHILMCGDSTNEDDVRRLCGGGGPADLLITDPPYNVDLGITDIEEAKKRRRRTDGLQIQNDAMSAEDFRKFLIKAMSNAEKVMRAGAVYYIWHADSNGMLFREVVEEVGLPLRQNLIWVKNALVPCRQDYQWRHEPCLYGWKPGAGHYFTDSRAESTVWDDSPDLEHISKADAIELLRTIYERVATSTIYENRPTTSKLHPTMKPATLIGYQIANSSRRGETVLDLFGGSGTTLIACEQLGRSCRMMEYDPHYCDVIIDRWEKFTGRKAELIDD